IFQSVESGIEQWTPAEPAALVVCLLEAVVITGIEQCLPGMRHDTHEYARIVAAADGMKGCVQVNGRPKNCLPPCRPAKTDDGALPSHNPAIRRHQGRGKTKPPPVVGLFIDLESGSNLKLRRDALAVVGLGYSQGLASQILRCRCAAL